MTNPDLVDQMLKAYYKDGSQSSCAPNMRRAARAQHVAMQFQLTCDVGDNSLSIADYNKISNWLVRFAKENGFE